MSADRNLTESQHRCLGEHCWKRANCLRYTQRTTGYPDAPIAHRFCDEEREHEGFIAATVIRRAQ